MKANSLQEEVNSLESSLPELRAHRASTPFDNDVFEAATYWTDLGKRATSGDARVNYPERAREELALLAKLVEKLGEMPTEARPKYLRVFASSKRLLTSLEMIQLDGDGYLGTLSAVKAEFGFLQSGYGFRIAKAEPTGLRYSSGAVYIELQYSVSPSLSCSFGPESEGEVSFWIEDLLFLVGDQRYLSFSGQQAPLTKREVRDWFAYLASIWKQYGGDILACRPGIFDRLSEAQRLRDAEAAAVMERQPDGRA